MTVRERRRYAAKNSLGWEGPERTTRKRAMHDLALQLHHHLKTRKRSATELPAWAHYAVLVGAGIASIYRESAPDDSKWWIKTRIDYVS